MKVPSFLRINKNDYPKELQDVIDKLAYAVNTNFEVLYNIFTKNISLRENLYGLVKDVSVTVDNDGIPTTLTSFSIDNNVKVDGLLVINANNITNSKIYPTGGIFINFTQQGASVIINHVTGLQASNSYNLRIVTFYQ